MNIFNLSIWFTPSLHLSIWQDIKLSYDLENSNWNEIFRNDHCKKYCLPLRWTSKIVITMGVVSSRINNSLYVDNLLCSRQLKAILLVLYWTFNKYILFITKVDFKYNFKYFLRIYVFSFCIHSCFFAVIV